MKIPVMLVQKHISGLQITIDLVDLNFNYADQTSKNNHKFCFRNFIDMK